MKEQPRNRQDKFRRRRKSGANTKAATGNTGRRLGRKRLSLEPLESRLLLANRVIIDFTPDTIAGEYSVGRFLELFDGSAVNNANRFLDYNSDHVVDTADAPLAAKKIANRVGFLLKDFADESDIDLRVLYTNNLTAAGDPGVGEVKLADGQDSSLNNTYVIYVGSDSPIPNSPDLGFAHQAFQGENNEFWRSSIRKRFPTANFPSSRRTSSSLQARTSSATRIRFRRRSRRFPRHRRECAAPPLDAESRRQDQAFRELAATHWRAGRQMLRSLPETRQAEMLEAWNRSTIPPAPAYFVRTRLHRLGRLYCDRTPTGTTSRAFGLLDVHDEPRAANAITIPPT